MMCMYMHFWCVVVDCDCDCVGVWEVGRQWFVVE